MSLRGRLRIGKRGLLAGSFDTSAIEIEGVKIHGKSVSVGRLVWCR